MPDRRTCRAVLFRSPVFRQHQTGSHPENPSRIVAIERELESRNLLDDRPVAELDPATALEIARIHDPELLCKLESIAQGGGGWVDADTFVGPDSVDVARLSAGAAIAAVNTVIDGPTSRAFVISRPPGHHATPSRSMGFCLINTVAIAAAHAIHRSLERVAILDWDVHHGNGTQDAFYDRSDVFYCSLHRSPFYPGTGAATETGRGDGRGFTLNIPLPAQTGDATYLHHIRNVVTPAIAAFQPELLLVSAGYDPHVSDPLGGMDVTEHGFQKFTRIAVEIADRCCNGRLVLILEGGYDPPALARCVADAIEILDAEVTKGGVKV